MLCGNYRTEPPPVVRAMVYRIRGRGPSMCRACARDGKNAINPRASPRGSTTRTALNFSRYKPPNPPRTIKFLFGWFRLTPPRNKSTCRFYGHFVGVCPNGQLLRVVRCHGVARSYLLRCARLSSSGLTCRAKCRFSH